MKERKFYKIQWNIRIELETPFVLSRSTYASCFELNKRSSKPMEYWKIEVTLFKIWFHRIQLETWKIMLF